MQDILTKQRFLGCFLLALVVYLFFYFYQPVETEDVWWHLATGQWMETHQSIPKADPFPYLNENSPWNCMHWLGSFILYKVYDLGGLIGLKIFRLAYFVLLLGVFYAYAKRFITPTLLGILIIFTAFAFQTRAMLRPDMLNHAFIMAYFYILFKYIEDLNYRRLLIIPLLSMLWFNVHMGAFVYGFSMIGIFLCASLLERAWIKVRHLSMLLVCAVLVCLINPYGLEGLLYPLKVFLFPEYFEFYAKSNTTVESQSGLIFFLSPAYFYYPLLALITVVSIFLTRKNQFLLMLIFLVGLGACICMRRNCAFFVLSCIYVIYEAFKHGQITAYLKQWKQLNLISGLLVFLLSFFLIASSWNYARLSWIDAGKRNPYTSINTNLYVEHILELARRAGLEGGVYSDAIIGNRLLLADYPRLRPLYDGRQLDNQRFKNYFAIMLNPQVNWEMGQRAYGFNTAIIFSNDLLFDYLSQRQDWQLIGISGYVLLYVKKDAFNLAEEFRHFKEGLENEVFTAADKIEFTALMERASHEATFYSKYVESNPGVIDTYSEALVLFKLGYNNAAMNRLLATLKMDQSSATLEKINFALRKYAGNS